MQIVVQARKLDKFPSLRRYTKRRLGFEFDRLEQYINRIDVKLSDINGPKGGEDKNCRIQFNIPNIGGINVGHVDSDIFVAIDRASDKAKRQLNNKMGRLRKNIRGKRAELHDIIEQDID